MLGRVLNTPMESELRLRTILKNNYFEPVETQVANPPHNASKFKIFKDLYFKYLKFLEFIFFA